MRSQVGGSPLVSGGGLALIGLTAALLLGAGLRFHSLGEPGLWVDEAYTVGIAHGPLSALFAQLRADDAPPFYYLVQAGLLRLLGSSESAARSLSAFASLGALVLLYRWGRRFGTVAACFVAFAWGASNLAVFYAQQARSYALLHLGVAALLLLGSRIWEARANPEAGPPIPRAPTRDELLFVLVSLGLLYTHNLAVWTLLAAWAWILPAFRGRFGRLALFAGTFLLGAVPWTIATLGQLGVHGELNAWMGGWWETHPLALGPIYSLGVFSNGTSSWVRPPTPFPSLAPGRALLVYAVWGSVGLGLVLAAFRSLPGRFRPLASQHLGPSPPTRPAISTGAWLLLGIPLGGLLVTTLFLGPAYVVGRTDTFALVPFIALLGLGWSTRPRSWGAVAVGLWVLVGIWVVLGPHSVGKGTDRALATWIGSEVVPGDAVVVSALGRPTLEHYALQGGWRERLGDLRAYPAELDRNPAAVYPTPLDSVASYQAQARVLRARWEAEGSPHVWILAPLAPIPDPAATTGRPGFPGPGAEPLPPPALRRTITANDLLYPTSVLLYTLRGLEPVTVLREYRQDWVGGERIALRIPRDQFVPLDSLQKIQTES